MAETTTKVRQNKDLFPTTERIMDPVSYACAWVGGNISIGAFMIGASLVPPSGVLNFVQAALALLLGLTLTALTLTINGAAGHKYGIPFVVHARSVFGVLGLKVPAILRGLPALFWFGVQSWVGSSALNAVCERVFGFDNIWVVFILFNIFQAIFAMAGMKGIKWLENVGVIVIFCSIIYMLYIIVSMYGVQLTNTLFNIEGSWGLPFWAGVTVAVGYSSTIILNICDYTRDVTKSIPTKLTFILHWVGFVPSTLLMCTIGLMTSNATGVWDPVALFTETMPDSPVLIVSLVFIAFAQITTNMYNNLIPASMVVVDFTKISQKKAAVICVALSVLTCPWAITEAGAFILFVQVYTAFLSPLFAVMVCDYYFVRKQELDIDMLYDLDGPYAGTNWSAMVAILIGALCSLIIPDISWFVALLPSSITYYLLMKYKPLSPAFLTGSVFSK